MPRLDVLVTNSGLAESRERAQALILAGKVRVAGETVRRPDRAVSDDALIDVDAGPGYASRGALKLAPALDRFGVSPAGRVCADIGASTGGFTDVLLRRGAEKDVSFITLEKVLPGVRRAAAHAEVVALFKPQFEVGRSQVGKGGIVRDEAAVESALLRFREWCAANGYEVTGEAPSDLAGADGNREIFVHLQPVNA